MSAPLDLTKPYRQRGGRKARFLGEIADPEFPLAFALERGDGREGVDCFTREGRWLLSETDDRDIVNCEAADG
ncbi:hypothetical protein A1351_22020 [Methylosinus sp. R-45379]|uniref:hypothetical protein n=1 Tax=Methylosinus sp. R-45379 TaxID=980563 RepID=UPI0007C98489|nr:hypothetical protein [Methylosinus sp. R-45379]OAI31104.1 hypothetical protein A1351_22020 [Methylosinus sp. R-45379]